MITVMVIGFNLWSGINCSQMMKYPPTISMAQATAPEINPLCQGERMIRIGHSGQKTAVGNMNHSW